MLMERVVVQQNFILTHMKTNLNVSATRARTRSGKTQFGRKIQPHKAITIAAVTAMLSLICWLRN